MPKNRIHDDDYEPDFIIPGFASHCNHDGRGVAPFVKENFDYVILDEFDYIYSSSLVCKVKLPNNEYTIFVLCYRSPNNIEMMTENVNALIDDINKNKVIILGDFNFPDIDWDSYAKKMKTTRHLRFFLVFTSIIDTNM